MPRSAQLNIRSVFARTRAHELARATGLTVTQVVEDALRAYAAPNDVAVSPNMVRRGPLWVRVSEGRRISLEDANAALDEDRERDA